MRDNGIQNFWIELLEENYQTLLEAKKQENILITKYATKWPNGYNMIGGEISNVEFISIFDDCNCNKNYVCFKCRKDFRRQTDIPITDIIEVKFDK